MSEREKKKISTQARRRLMQRTTITVKLTLPFENEIQFADACKGAANKLIELADKALHDGDFEQFKGTKHEVTSDNDDAEPIGAIEVSL